MIIQGDGSWEKLMDYGRCPRCKGAVNQIAKPHAKRECHSCGLTIIDNSAESYKIKDDKPQQESDMYETRLEATEHMIAADQKPVMSWGEAVSTIERVLEEYLNDPEPVHHTLETEVLEAWHRILRG